MSIESAPKRRLGILASGAGTTSEAIFHETLSGHLEMAEVAAVVSNNADAPVLERFTRINENYDQAIELYVVNGQDTTAMTDRASERLCDIDQAENIDLWLALGFMQLIRGRFLEKDIINFHPGPLPLTAGKAGLAVQEAVIAAGVDSASTVHWVDAGLDTGQSIFSIPVERRPGDTPESLRVRVQATEKKDTLERLGIFMRSQVEQG